MTAIEGARTTRRRAETRRRLIEAAREVFNQHGIRDAPVEAICDRAGFSRGAFYSNFDSKEDLFLAVYESEMGARTQRLRIAVDRAADRVHATGQDAVIELVGQAAELFMTTLVADEQWYLLVAEFRAQALRQPELRGPTAAAETRFHRGLGEIMAALLDRLGMRLTVAPEDLVQVVVALYETMLTRALLDGAADRTHDRYLTRILPQLLTGMIASNE
ncbi:TetR/AcrR family transcriptional regulator [Crossiella cryophila]|uniref:AcrR family transcriptional regulator n=1 Tax=Crossiella cryophila TaxID=43355 RepID=A0A7W7FU00_9PSEU|nr:helix-turn-helix domain-containing protein [Crossiella cryophila]MBB4678711.1 AcrR family transcriptional regulator [Crossiella cryophila]